MKKVLLVLALVAVYGVSMAMSSATVVTVDNAKITIVADMDENTPADVEKEKKESKKAKAKEAKAKTAEGCSGAKADAKAEGCATKAKADCASSCGGEKAKK